MKKILLTALLLGTFAQADMCSYYYDRATSLTKKAKKAVAVNEIYTAIIYMKLAMFEKTMTKTVCPEEIKYTIDAELEENEQFVTTLEEEGA